MCFSVCVCVCVSVAVCLQLRDSRLQMSHAAAAAAPWQQRGGVVPPSDAELVEYSRSDRHCTRSPQNQRHQQGNVLLAPQRLQGACSIIQHPDYCLNCGEVQQQQQQQTTAQFVLRGRFKKGHGVIRVHLLERRSEFRTFTGNSDGCLISTVKLISRFDHF